MRRRLSTLFLLILIAVNTSCTALPVHPTKTQEQFKEDKEFCRKQYRQRVTKSGMLYYRNSFDPVRHCLHKKGWSYQYKFVFSK